MNLVHLKYAVEVDKTQSISKAADNLFMGQPNLSRAIKELEDALGITIFKRTSKGISTTLQGEEFIQYAKNILMQVDEMEAHYQNFSPSKQTFSISVPRASYVACAFTEFANLIDKSKKSEIFYKETNSMRAINNILQADYKLGIIRYQISFEQYFNTLLHEKDLLSDVLLEFRYQLVISKTHPLANKPTITLKDLSHYIEIAHADPFVPSLPLMDARKAELSTHVDKRIYVFERGSQFDLLSNVEGTFMWVSPIPQRLLDQYGLVQRDCEENTRIYRDVMICKKGYRFTELDMEFLNTLREFINHIK